MARTIMRVFFAAVEAAHVVVQHAEVVDGENDGGGGGLQDEV